MHNEDENTPRKVSDEIINFAPAEQKFRSAGVKKSTVPAAPEPGEVTKTLSAGTRGDRGCGDALGAGGSNDPNNSKAPD